MLKNTPLLNEHKKLNARMGTFGGWQMPIQYEGIIAEHKWTRNSASVFDICHMGEFLINGDLIKSNMNIIFTMKLNDLCRNRCCYGFILNEEGNIIDDLIVYRLEDDKWMVVVNCATTIKDESHIKSLLSSDAEFNNISDITAKIDVQGPLSEEVLLNALSVDVSGLKYFNFRSFTLFGKDAIISRTGYTGELGYEIYINSANVKELWQVLCEDRMVRPGGLGARDTLRLEMCYPLYGQDIDETKNPYEANFMNFVCLDKDFYGKEALLKKIDEGSSRFLVPLKCIGRRPLRHNYKIFADDKEIGVVTSGSFSPSLACAIGLGYVDKRYAKPGTQVTVTGGNGQRIEALVSERPLYKKGGARD